MSLRVLLDDQIESLYDSNPELKSVKKNAFEVSVAHFANLKYLGGLEQDDLIDGIMGEGGDEGIDHCYVFCNGNLVNDEEHPINKDSSIRVKFFQTKKESSFSTDGFRKTKEGIEQIFNLDLELSKLKTIGANKDILEKAELIRKIFRRAKKNKAQFMCELYYVTASADKKISEKIHHLTEEMKSTLRLLDIEIDVAFWGAQELLNMTKSLNESIEIQFNSQPMEIKDRDVPTSGFSGFVTGNSIIESLLFESGEFKSHLTEGNVRYFLGEDVKINSSIIETINDKTKTDIFWAMNNGLTIIADNISPLGNNQYDIENPQIVNGCQTVHCLYHSYKESQSLPANLKVFLKLVKTDNLDIQTDIISATNSQNPVKAASLKANDDIQRNIETHLKKAGIFYERRENFYKRQGITGNRVIGLLKMAQIVHSVVNKEAVVAANDTTTLFDSESKYSTLFSDAADFDIYTFSVHLFQKIWSTKNSDLRTSDYHGEEKDLISKGGFLFLHCLSSLILTESFNRHSDNGTTELMTQKFSISEPQRKNKFYKCKTIAFQLINDEEYIKKQYDIAKSILFEAATVYQERNPSKLKISLFKNRNFDKEFLIPTIEKRLKPN
ncbi:AIPR protein [Pseudoalteromonas sp. P1-9]|uniref:AIPR family protein n=1 Tax=Pseudoalteromonas sp. P1-9 TaxID=1710354 RepID=UPI0006D5D262|nr:AIPR family protein [Pseudoalteromonas sp. P1-9]KPV93686.1 AIPR protein [Pseudoalteromonas sp. P1-9]